MNGATLGENTDAAISPAVANPLSKGFLIWLIPDPVLTSRLRSLISLSVCDGMRVTCGEIGATRAGVALGMPIVVPRAGAASGLPRKGRNRGFVFSNAIRALRSIQRTHP